MLVRKIGSFLRGKATPVQVVLACLLGSLLGFIPGFWQGPGLTVALVLLLIMLNVNLFVAGVVGVGAKLASLVLMPVSFTVGTWLLHGATEPLFRAMINAPVLALFGFEYYATTGGLVVGLAFGLLVGGVLARGLSAFRRRMASIEEGSERYRAFTSKGWVKALSFVFIGGGKGKATYADLLERRIGNPVRWLGVVFAVLFVALLVIVQMFASEPLVTAALQRGLERLNGATVDVESAELDLRGQRLTVTGLAAADPGDLGRDLLRAGRLEANLSGADLLRKRLTFDRIEVTDAGHGQDRARRGVLVGRPPAPAPAPPDTGTADGPKTIDDYIKEAEEWKERLAQVRRWLEELAGGPAEDPAPGADPGETWSERLRREVELKGYARVAATHLIEDAPTVLVREVVINGISTKDLPGEPLDVRATNLSTHPRLVAGTPRITADSRAGTLSADVRLGVGSAPETGGIFLSYKGLPADRVAAHLVQTDPPLIRGGTIDLLIDGTWSPEGVGSLDIPLMVTLKDSTLSLPRAGSAQVRSMTLPIGLSGSLDNPAVRIDGDQLASALMEAGAGELAGRVRAEAEKAVGKAVGGVTEQLEERVGEKARDAVDGILGGLRRRTPEDGSGGR